ncbi:hypothetical protein ACFE04_005529 [Oxalis oulophora]
MSALKLPSNLKHTIKLLKHSADTKKLKLGQTIHAHLIITTKQPSSIEDATAQTTSLINHYVKCDQVWVARKLFDEMPKRTVASYSALMIGYIRNGYSSEVHQLFKTMASVDDISPNEYIFSNVLQWCAHMGKVVEGKQWHGFLLKLGFEFFPYVKNVLVDMYAKCFDTESAMRVLDSLPGYNDVCPYNSILNSLLDHGCLREAVEVFERMMVEDVSWDNDTFVCGFRLSAALKDLILGLTLHGRMMKSHIFYDPYIDSAVINMYGKCGNILNARKYFDAIETQNVVLWTAMIDAYYQKGYFEKALNFFSNMKIRDISANEFTFAVLLNSAAELSALRHGDSLHAHIEKSGLKDYVIIGNALITMYSKGGDIKAANKVFSKMVHRDIISWNMIIHAYSHHGLGKEALTLFREMLTLSTQLYPNHVTFVGVLSACGHLGLVKEGFFYLNHLMKQFGVEPGLEHFTCIISLLSKAGKLDDAEKFMRSKPVKWDIVAWRTLLSACHVHKNYDLGIRIAETCLKVDPNDVGTYTLSSNMLAKYKEWDGVAQIRKVMKKRNIKKEPGVSWIEIKNKVHVFVSEDYKHPESDYIGEKVRDLLAEIKPLGYVPDIDNVLHDVEDEQKEEYLSYHSEKLALAYGLMKSPSEAPIRVYKNLRICDDCHTAFKLISKLKKRVIIVRDVKRFHSFQDGSCSCADYW